MIMLENYKPQFSGSRHDKLAKRLAKLQVYRGMKNSINNIAEALSKGQSIPPAQVGLIETQIKTLDRPGVTGRYLRDIDLELRVLKKIGGVGGTLAPRILNHFGSLRKVAESSEDELAEVKGVADQKAKVILESLREFFDLEKSDPDNSRGAA